MQFIPREVGTIHRIHVDHDFPSGQPFAIEFEQPALDAECSPMLVEQVATEPVNLRLGQIERKPALGDHGDRMFHAGSLSLLTCSHPRFQAAVEPIKPGISGS